MQEPSGKFVLRIPTDMHARLKREARRSGVSLNQTCLHLLNSGLSHKGSELLPAMPVPSELIKQIKRHWKHQIIGSVLFGSAARNESRESSDIDLLLVLKPNSKIQRDLYRTWDKMLLDLEIENPNIYSPQFVSLPKKVDDAGGLWFEIALDGQILWEEGSELSHFLREVKTAIAEGRIRRRLSHGHPYWERHLSKETKSI